MFVGVVAVLWGLFSLVGELWGQKYAVVILMQ